jgi:rhodanese-related sulfurtransferase
MKTSSRIALAAVAALGVSLAARADAPKVEKIAPKAAAELAEQGKATIIDVREQDEVNAGMAKPAKWFPLSKIKKDPEAYKAFLSKQPKGKLIFYCAMGYRAEQAAEEAAKLGYPAGNLGGFKDWRAAGLPTKDKP